ncbi:MAG: preprotein translocase subunit SecA [Bacteroidales bacterium]
MSSFATILGKLFGNKSDKDIKKIMPLVDEINKEYKNLSSLSHDQLREETDKLRQIIKDATAEEESKITELKAEAENVAVDQSEELFAQVDKLEEAILEKLKSVLMDILPQAFAIMKDTARRFAENSELKVSAREYDKELATERNSIEINGDIAVWHNTWEAGGNTTTWSMIHYDVQLIGGIVLHEGKISEMATGEGKTLVATLPVFLNALAGRGVHIVTVNDYLSKRDAEWMGPLYEFHGLSVDCIDKHTPNSRERREAYQADITFGTNNEFGFDYLRDNMAINIEDLVQRTHHYAIVDEVDSVLIDDARTPLIISGPVPKGDQHEFNELKPQIDRLVTKQRSLITQLLSDAKRLLGKEDATKQEKEEGALSLLRAHKGFPKYKPLIKFLSEPGMKDLMHKTENFYMQNNNEKMHIVTDPLFFVIEEKMNSVELTDNGVELISSDVSDSKFFVMPDIGAEIAEIEKSTLTDEEKIDKKDSLIQDYAVKSERVHTINQLLKAYTMFERDVEYIVNDNKVLIVDEQTGRIMDGRRYSDGLHQAIEAKENVKVEAATQTYATITLQNYFRMYNKLSGMTGTAETDAGEFWSTYKLDVVVIPTNRPIQRDDRNDLIFLTKRQKYKAIIEEVLRLTEAGRPVLVGTTAVDVSETLSKMLKLRGIQHNVLNAKLHAKEADVVAEAGLKGAVTIATNMAGRGTDIKLSDGVKASGGLAIIGSERHESRRVDRQLRGRAGRQGDPGSSQFFISAEDNLMRLFGENRMYKILSISMKEDDDPVESKMLNGMVEKAQRRVEENHFGTRKRLLDYDKAMQSQREVIYKRRKNALFGDRLDADLMNMLYDTVYDITSDYQNVRDYNGFKLETLRALAQESNVSEEEFLNTKTDVLAEKVFSQVLDGYKRKQNSVAEKANPVIEDVYVNHGTKYTNIVVPITDGSNVYNIVTNLEKAHNTSCKELVRSYERQLSLRHIDDAWKEQLRKLDDLKQSVQSAVYEQKDPVLIYKKEAYDLFKEMITNVNQEIIASLMRAHIQERAGEDVHEGHRQHTDMSKLQTSREASEERSKQQQRAQGNAGQQRQVTQPIKSEKQVGRNEPCPCGSGKKYKHCHGK